MTVRRKFLFYILIWFYMSGCAGDSTKPNKIVLIFQDWSAEDPFVDQVSTVKYVDDYLIPHVFRPGDRERVKHVVLTSREYIDIAMGSGDLTTHFLLRSGDSALVKLRGKWPVLTLLNRQASDYESNFEFSKQQDLYGDHPSPLEDYFYYWSRANSDINPVSGSVISKELSHLKEKAFDEIDRTSFYIDSLLYGDVISPEIAAFYQLKNAYLRDRLKLFEVDKINFSNVETIRSIMSSVNENSIDSTPYISTFHDDFATVYYHGFLSTELNSRTHLDSLAKLGHFSLTFGKSLLFKHLQELLTSSSVEEGKALLVSVNDDLLSEHWLDYFCSKYNLDQNFATDWGISNHQKATFSFQNILEEKQGTLLYVDFWASWCLKSIRQAPALEKLYNDYNTKGVSIVHISADSEIEKWKWADNEYLWFNQSNSYMLDSSDVAIIRDEFLIYSIPRYLLFDRNGKLVHINAPEPSSSEIRDLLDAHLGNTPI